MPGSVYGDMFEMPLEDALTVIAALDRVAAQMHATQEELAELRRAAQAVVDEHAVGIVARYASKRVADLRVVK
jgi:hypothetical protein